MIGRIMAIARNTFREAIRDRVLYNLIVFAILIVGSAFLVGEVSIGIERLVLINLGLTAISLFGIVIAVFVGIGLVSKEIERRTLYTVLAARPVRRWEFIAGKWLGLILTLTVNSLLMALGFMVALWFQQHAFRANDIPVLVALYFILLQFVLITSLALFFSTFSSPLLSSIFAFSLFVIGTFAEDLRNFAAMTTGISKFAATAMAYLVPNFSTLNVISEVAHGIAVPGKLIVLNTVYVLVYSAAVGGAAVAVFDRRNLK